MALNPKVISFFDDRTYTITHIVMCPETGATAVIDPVLDFDAAAGRTYKESAEAVINQIGQDDLTVEWVLETHVHADHLTAAPFVKESLGGRTGIGANVGTVQATFKKIFNAEDAFATDGSQFDHLFADGEEFKIGNLTARVMHTPGHTPACVTYVIGDAAFVGDTMFSPDYGSARCDFPGGNAHLLYASIQKILALPPETRIYLCHDYMPGGREVMMHTTVAEQKAENIHLKDCADADAFAAMRNARDAKLGMPALIIPSVQVNMRGGQMPPPEDNGVSYLKTPVDLL
jgi:glyoxylase-like metal-dependent hydrolase (beta-lactamase superfamily II)